MKEVSFTALLIMKNRCGRKTKSSANKVVVVVRQQASVVMSNASR
jgi:hypothetical protein